MVINVTNDIEVVCDELMADFLMRLEEGSVEAAGAHCGHKPKNID